MLQFKFQYLTVTTGESHAGKLLASRGPIRASRAISVYVCTPSFLRLACADWYKSGNARQIARALMRIRTSKLATPDVVTTRPHRLVPVSEIGKMDPTWLCFVGEARTVFSARRISSRLAQPSSHFQRELRIWKERAGSEKLSLLSSVKWVQKCGHFCVSAHLRHA